MPRRPAATELAYTGKVVRRNGGTGRLHGVAPVSAETARRQLATLLPRRGRAFVCASCREWVAIAGSAASAAGATERAKQDGVLLASLGPEDWRAMTFGDHLVCGLCTGLFHDALTPARPLVVREPRRTATTSDAAKRSKQKHKRDRDPLTDVLDCPWVIVDGAFEGGRRR